MENCHTTNTGGWRNQIIDDIVVLRAPPAVSSSTHHRSNEPYDGGGAVVSRNKADITLTKERCLLAIDLVGWWWRFVAGGASGTQLVYDIRTALHTHSILAF